MTRLRRDLLQNYDKNNRPVDQKFRNTTEIYISFFMRYINEFDEVAGHLKSTVGIQVYWKDRRLAWDPGNYSGFKDSLTFNLKDLWVPHVTLWNPVDTFIILDPENDQLMVAVEAEESLVHYLIGGVITTHCVPNVKYFPFDSHTCEINLIIWHIHKENSSVVEIMGFSIAKFPYVLRRRPMFMLFNLLIPILLLSFLNICVFAIPIQSGERTSFSITVFLALAVFMTVVADHVPHSSSPMPLWSIFLLFKLVFSASIALCSTFVIRMFHRSHLRQIPTVLVWIAGVWDKLHDLCSSRPKKHDAGKEENNSSITLPDDYGSTIIHDWSDHSSLSSSGQLTWPHVAYNQFLFVFKK
ncbi:hypothetical protein KUTeg_012466 [Tegillarca granosa]|uniref:Uncharacterized protein n=1 Tax=Tegillarca granosa TaxID=220873 RepID=A0ABQ9F338_TEGGR|nr:hypothetical protein KUTeg_012466 [Tegillarca granosa]